MGLNARRNLAGSATLQPSLTTTTTDRRMDRGRRRTATTTETPGSSHRVLAEATSTLSSVRPIVPGAGLEDVAMAGHQPDCPSSGPRGLHQQVERPAAAQQHHPGVEIFQRVSPHAVAQNCQMLITKVDVSELMFPGEGVPQSVRAPGLTRSADQAQTPAQRPPIDASGDAPPLISRPVSRKGGREGKGRRAGSGPAGD